MSEPPLPSARRQLFLMKYGPVLITPFFFGFSTHVLSPNLFLRFDTSRMQERCFNLCFSSTLGPQINAPVANSLWIGSHTGIGIYLYVSKHLRNADTFDRILYR